MQTTSFPPLLPCTSEMCAQLFFSRIENKVDQMLSAAFYRKTLQPLKDTQGYDDKMCVHVKIYYVRRH